MSPASDPGPGALPDFLIVGAPKAGTTSLFAWLNEHPQVFMPEVKELRFFDDRWDRGVEWYRSQLAGAPPNAVVGEATPLYMVDPDAAPRMASVVPEAKLIAILRDPVDRAYSHWQFQQEMTDSPEPFSAMVDAACRAPDAPPSQIAAGCYARQLRRLSEHFDREQLLVLFFDDLQQDPDGTYSTVCGFLGVDDTLQPENLGRTYNKTFRVRSARLRLLMFKYSLWTRLPFRLGYAIDEWNKVQFEYPPLDPAVRERLAEWYRPHDTDLARWLGRALPW